MLKLVKYELIQSVRTYALALLSFFGLSIIFGFMFRIEYLFDFSIFVFIYHFIAIILLFVMFISVIYQFYKSMYSRSGYLTLTLPVSYSQLILSKVISTLIWFIIAMLIYLLSYTLFNIIICEMPLSEIKYFIESMLFINDTDLTIKITTLLCYIVLICVYVLKIYFVVTLVNTKYVRKHRFISGMVIYFIIDIIINCIYSLLFVSADSGILYMVLFGGARYYTSLGSDIGITNIAVNVIQAIIFFFMTTYLLDRCIEIE